MRWLNSIINAMGVDLDGLQETVEDRGVVQVVAHGVMGTQLSD